MEDPPHRLHTHIRIRIIVVVVMGMVHLWHIVQCEVGLETTPSMSRPVACGEGGTGDGVSCLACAGVRLVGMHEDY